MTPLAFVTSNTWFAYGTRIDQGVIEDEMKHVAELGAELFVLDAGWYAGAGRDGPFDFTAGLGDWHADESRFPSDLQGLADIAHSLGMKFGLWVEPERIDLGNVNSGDFADDTWLAMEDGRYDPAAPEGGPRAGQLCLASASARAWLVGQLASLIDRARPDYRKWDNNFWINCNREGHGHGKSDGNFAHVSGLYEVLAALRERYPQLIIENVSGGGNRLDYGMLQFTDVGWMDDRTAPSLHVRHNLEGLGAAFPPSYLFSFLIDHESESLSTGSDLPLYIRSRMAGVLGLTFRTAELRASAARDIAAHIGIYKTLRGTIQGGSLVLLTRQASADDPPSWDAVQESDAAGRTLIFAFQVDPGAVRITLRPHGLKPDATYDVSSIDLGPIGSASGADLMAGGIEVVQSAESGAHVLVLSERP